MTRFTATGTENAMVWDRAAAPFMEVWYATVTHRRLRSGLWLRYTIASPRHGEPSCALWASYFDPEGKRSFAARDDYSIDRLGHVPGRDDGAVVRIGDAWLSETHLEGRVGSGGRAFAWSLDVEPADRCYQHLPPLLHRRAAARFSTLCSPNLSVPFTGTVELDGELVTYDGEPGGQTHRWGRRHSHSWAWAHCSAWDDGTDAVFEAVTAKGTPWLPALSFPYLRYRGEDLVFSALRSRGRYELPVWSFTASNERWRIAGAARLPLGRSVQVRYSDPDGGTRHCVNSEIADLALEVYERRDWGWRHAGSLTATGTAHFEIGGTEPFPELPVAF